MKAWLYYRLSRDEDEEMNSLQNQRQILIDYAEQNGYEVVGESFDDNVSGMTFNRKGLGELENAVDEGKVEVVLVKDLSRLGRHRTQTALFIDHLRENKVKVISVTESIDTANENDYLLIGFKQIFNDFYAKDISKKCVRGYAKSRRIQDLYRHCRSVIILTETRKKLKLILKPQIMFGKYSDFMLTDMVLQQSHGL